MNQTLNLLTLTLGSIQIIDILIAIGLYLVYKRNTDYLIVTFIWVGMCLFFTGDHLLGDLGTSHIYLSYSFTALSGIGMGLLVSRHYQVKASLKKFIYIFLICFSLSILLKTIGITNFTLLAFVLSIGVTYPVFHSVYFAFKNLKNNPKVKSSAIDYAYLTIILIWGIHFLDYPFLRPLSNLEFSVFGFSFALLITYLTSILFPVIINRKIHLNFNEQLEDKLIAKTKELQNAQKQMIAKEKLATLGSLSAGIAHEIKNPLNIIKNGTSIINKFCERDLHDYQLQIDEVKNQDLLVKIKSDSERIQSVSRLIDKNVERADNIIRSMLTHSRTGKSILTKEDLNKIITDSLDLIISSSKAKYNFNVQSEFQLVAVNLINVYASDLGRALINIFDNAFYAMNEKKTDLSIKDYKPLIQISTQDLEEFIVIKIKDNGIGIPKDEIQEILNPFYTTKPSGDGTGLGLSMVNDVMKLHKGDIQIDSEIGQYTEFTLKLLKSL